jgi:TonB family protein
MMLESTLPGPRDLRPGHYRGAAIALSVLGHGLAIGAIVLLSQRALAPPPEEPAVRLVFVESAPPPRLGVPDGGSVAGPAAAPAPPQAIAAPEEPKAAAPPAVKPSKPEVHAALHPAVKPAPHAAIHAQPRDAAPPAPAAPAAPSESASASAGPTGSAPPGPAAGSLDGNAAGVDGGLPGGRVGGLGTEILPAGQAAVAPSVVRRVMPIYPELARARGIEGQVVIEAIIATDGHIEPDIKVVHSIPALDAAAIEAFRKWQFSPARDATGKPLRVFLQAPVRFVLR